jgi:sec-independent protein translocase protein TatA
LAPSGGEKTRMLGDPLQFVIIGVIVVVVFLWGPKKIPELARSLGLAKREFDKAQNGDEKEKEAS